MKKRTLVWFMILYCSYFFSVEHLPLLHAGMPMVIKFATIAPEGSNWTNVMHDIDNEIQTKSNGSIRLKIYAGATMGDEITVIRKMRVSQLHCSALTSIGLVKILPEAKLFDLPLFYRDQEELDLIKNDLYDYFNNAFDKKGYVLLGWSELGFISFFSKKEIKSMSEIRSAKMWLWEGDPLAETLFNFLDISPIPLELPFVEASLHTGSIDTVYGPPLAVIALNWFKHTKYMLDIPLANATGAILMQKKFFNKLSPDNQRILKETFRKHMVNLSRLIQVDNAKSKEALKTNGVELIIADDTLLEELKHASRKTCQQLTGKLFSNELLNKVVTKLKKYRKSNHSHERNEYAIKINDIANGLD